MSGVSQEQAGQERAGQEQAAQERAGQVRAGQVRAAQERAAQELVVQEKAAQDGSRQDHARQTGLTADQYASYRRNGFLAGLPVFDAAQTRKIREDIETLERDHAKGAGGRALDQYFRVNGQLVIPLLAQVARSPQILDIVETVLGPNLLVWSVELFIKEPGSAKTVSWHQDLTYWGMGETDDEVTAWLALSDVSEQAGCMRFIPGSHRGGIVDHTDTFADSNLLSRGQQIDGIDESQAVLGPLAPGQISLHHGRCFHASGPNRSDDRRIGMAIRYVTPDVRHAGNADLGRDYAMLVRGMDRHKGWIPVAGPRGLFAAEDLALYETVLQDQSSVLAAGASADVALYQQAEVPQ